METAGKRTIPGLLPFAFQEAAVQYSKTEEKNEPKQKGEIIMWIFIGTLTYILILLVCILSYAIDYLTNVIQVESFSQFLYTMQVSMGGAENTIMQILQGFFAEYALYVGAATIVYIILLRTLLQARRNIREGKPAFSRRGHEKAVRFGTCTCGFLAACMLAGQLVKGYDVLGIEQYRIEQNRFSRLYEDHYVKTDSSLVQLPEKKKNLIHIVVESMESSYADSSIGGGFDDNLIPQLSTIAKENTDFSASDDPMLNGARVTNKTSWTVAGLVAQTSSTPIAMDNGEYDQNFDGERRFMPNITTLGELLEEAGYTNAFLCGSDASYAGRANYFRQHGNYEITDWISQKEDGVLPSNYKEWWGFEDEKLFEYAKESLLDLSSRNEPFNFTMLTADTHFKNGYLCPDCPDLYEDQMKNVIACSDARIASFISWLQQQDFYEDTVVVISGDHLSMDGLIPAEVGREYTRRVFFTVINGPEYTLDKTRDYTTLDVFPTILEAMGASVEGHRLGLGTSLYADVPTLSEELGFSEFNSEIAYRSAYYESVILKGEPEEEKGIFH